MSAACLLCTETRGGKIFGGAKQCCGFNRNYYQKESEISDSTTESSISLSDEFENDENSEDEISRQQELVVKKIVSSEQEF